MFFNFFLKNRRDTIEAYNETIDLKSIQSETVACRQICQNFHRTQFRTIVKIIPILAYLENVNEKRFRIKQNLVF